MQGDDFNPGGTLTGGSRRQGHSTLAKVAEIEECEAHLDKLLVCASSTIPSSLYPSLSVAH